MKGLPSGWPTRRLVTPLLAPLLLSGLAACGGGGSSSSSDPTTPAPAPAPESTSVSSEGVITGFGSVYVNDLRYQLDDDTRVTTDDDERFGDDGALQLGMKVSIRAQERDGERIAESIRHRRDLKGPVTRLTLDADDPGIGTFFVANTRVVVDANTVFSPVSATTTATAPSTSATSPLPADDWWSQSAASPATMATWPPGSPAFPAVTTMTNWRSKGFVSSRGHRRVHLRRQRHRVSGYRRYRIRGWPDVRAGHWKACSSRWRRGGWPAAMKPRRSSARTMTTTVAAASRSKASWLPWTPSRRPMSCRSAAAPSRSRDASSLTGLVGSRVQIKGRFDDDGVLVLEHRPPAGRPARRHGRPRRQRRQRQRYLYHPSGSGDSSGGRRAVWKTTTMTTSA
jgi:hypothetical protein